MRTISLWEPWATLIAIGAKRIETRSWPTKYRGPIAIHAAKRRDEARTAFYISPFKEILAAAGIEKVGDLPFGAVVCLANLIDCVSTERITATISDQERAFGNYTLGRWAWVLDKVQPFEAPIPARGAQGLFDWKPPEDIRFAMGAAGPLYKADPDATIRNVRP